ncbi:hypothetical protein [Paenibacillus massiliensis]|uniref:hypothetical protein n=1 Tax=Paenibacillus massiliensis TaxID=225917 RepID=UPI00048E3E4F|nr:hypothetical protein [Paenibacillus massiliensis]
MKWKEPTFGATPMLKALTTASARKKAKSFDLVAEQKKQKLTYPDWAQDWMRKYKEAWYIAKANGDEVGMRKAQKLAEGLRSKLREMANMPKWAQEQMKKQTLLWMEGQATGNIRQMKAAEQAGKGIREKLDLIRTIAKTSKADADKLNELTAKWYAAHDHGLVDGKDLSKDPKAVKAAKDKYSQEAQAIIGKYQKPVEEEPPTANEEEKPPSSTTNTPSGKWIPASILKLSGSSEAEKYLNQRLSKFKKVTWNQSKVDGVWEASRAIDNAYQIQIDPRLLLAIIIQEGTGSFNTSSDNRAADGQHGVEKDYAKDLMKANSLIFGKILGYIYYGEDFRSAVHKNKNLKGISGDGDVFQYCNWSTPIIRMSSKRIDLGVYAGDNAWHSGVRKIYDNLSQNSSAEYQMYLKSIPKNKAKEIVQSEGIKLKNASFVTSRNGQTSLGKNNGEYTIVGKF